MNIIKRIVKEIVLVPYRALQGVDAAANEVFNPKAKKK